MSKSKTYAELVFDVFAHFMNMARKVYTGNPMELRMRQYTAELRLYGLVKNGPPEDDSISDKFDDQPLDFINHLTMLGCISYLMFNIGYGDPVIFDWEELENAIQAIINDNDLHIILEPNDVLKGIAEAYKVLDPVISGGRLVNGRSADQAISEFEDLIKSTCRHITLFIDQKVELIK